MHVTTIKIIFTLLHFLCLTPYFSNDTPESLEVDGRVLWCNILHTGLFSDIPFWRNKCCVHNFKKAIFLLFQLIKEDWFGTTKTNQNFMDEKIKGILRSQKDSYRRFRPFFFPFTF